MNEFLNEIVANWEVIVGSIVGLIVAIKNFAAVANLVGKQIVKAVDKLFVTAKEQTSEELNQIKTEYNNMKSEIVELKALVLSLVSKAAIDTEANIRNIGVDEELTSLYEELKDKL